MKKILFGLIATVMFSLNGNAQEISATSKKVLFNTQVITIVEASKAVYTKGMSYDDFIKNLLTPSPTSPSQEKFYRKVYFYVQNNTAGCDILKAETSEIENYIKELSSNKNLANKVDATPKKKKWWQILINAAVNVLLDIVEPDNTMNIDLFP